MGYGYSIDLLERVVEYCNAGGTTAEAKELFGIGRSSVRRWKNLKATNGSLAPLPHGGGNSRKIQPEDEPIVLRLLEGQPDQTVEELTHAFMAETKKEVSRSAMTRALFRIGMTRKKNSNGDGTTYG